MSTPTSPLAARLLAAMDTPEARAAGLQIPPPVFAEMGAEILSYSEDRVLRVRFPVRAQYQNPMGLMQGGMLAAAVDNVLGPLSYLVAPPSVTSTLAMTYLRPVRPTDAHVEVEGRLVERVGRQLVLEARVENPKGEVVALAQATCVIVGPRSRT